MATPGTCPDCQREDVELGEGRPMEYLKDAAPPDGVHRAGRMEQWLQRCVRCGALLAHRRYDSSWVLVRYYGLPPRPNLVPRTEYQEGDLVERRGSWQAVNARATEPTCALRSES